jgi:hypothetical protein
LGADHFAQGARGFIEFLDALKTTPPTSTKDSSGKPKGDPKKAPKKKPKDGDAD